MATSQDDTDGEKDKYELFEERTDEIWDGLERSYAAGFLKAIEVYNIDTGGPDDPDELRKVDPVSEAHYYYWDGKTLPLQDFLERYYGVGLHADDDADPPTDPEWEDLPDECPECGEGTYLAARIKEFRDIDGVRVFDKAELICGEHTHNVPVEPLTEDMRGCGHQWMWERDPED